MSCRASATKRGRAVLAFLGVTTFGSCVMADPTAEQREEAREHFRLGNEAFARGENEAALGEYQSAYVLARSFDIACNLGRVEYQLGLWPHAADHLGECLENFSASTRAELRTADERLSQLFEEVRGKVALLRVDVQPERANVTVGSRSVLGPWPAKVYVLPGEQVITATSEGREPETRTLTLEAGTDQVVHFDLAPKQAEPAPAAKSLAPVAPPPEDASGDTLAQLQLPVLVAGGVLSAVGIGFGAYFLSQHGQLEDDADAKRRALQGDTPSASKCHDADGPNAGDCASLKSSLEDADQARRFAVGGFVAGGVLAVGTVAAYFLWPETSSEAPVRVEPQVGLGGERGVWGAALSGRF